MRLQNKEAQHLTRIFLENILHGKEIVLRLAHLLFMDCDEAVMQPVARKAVVIAAAALGLRDFILMMREDQITAAAVEVKGLAQVLQ